MVVIVLVFCCVCECLCISNDKCYDTFIISIVDSYIGILAQFTIETIHSLLLIWQSKWSQRTFYIIYIETFDAGITIERQEMNSFWMLDSLFNKTHRSVVCFVVTAYDSLLFPLIFSYFTSNVEHSQSLLTKISIICSVLLPLEMHNCCVSPNIHGNRDNTKVYSLTFHVVQRNVRRSKKRRIWEEANVHR